VGVSVTISISIYRILSDERIYSRIYDAKVMIVIKSVRFPAINWLR
jgi:hypothetical protein